MEKVGLLHVQLSGTLRDEANNMELFRERQKEQKKKFEFIMDRVQKRKVCLYKKTIEADEAEQAVDKIATIATATPKQTEKLQNKSKQCREAAVEAVKQYTSNVEQLEVVRQEWESTHITTCEGFQQLEVERINALRNALWMHSNHLSIQCVHDDECYEDLRKTLENCDIAEDNNCFVDMKRTVPNPPAPITFENYYERQTVATNGDTAGFVGAMKRFTNLLQGNNLSSSRSNICEPGSKGETTLPNDSVYASIPGLPQEPAAYREFSEEYKVLYDYVAQGDDELSISAGDTVVVIDQGQDGWWTVERNNQSGLVPGSYLTLSVY
ncbi:hypothetical protein CRUP_030499 [Coryphaenoides rupestris]|nr:hypothetical protein CRUP_030499 [Coryphaenoides rupestris]